jgi:NAD(P)-dependent dehydrogenase (short-subunit alcohol dehydrogenase family)
MKQKSAVVSGSSSGIGVAICQYLLDQDYYVYGLSRRGINLDYDNYVDILCDIRDEKQVEAAFHEIEQSGLELSLLVNNAGICEMYPLSETSSNEFKNHLDTNVLGTFHLLKHFELCLSEQQSHVINILSIAAKQSFAQSTAYTASKHGMKGLIESCQKEWDKYRVKFSNLYPGAIDTPLWNSLGEDYSRSKMLSIEEFMTVFASVIEAPFNVQFPDITFLHRDGLL